MTISNEAVEAAARVLVAHQRQNAGSCLCGWARLGYSHPEHQAALVMEAIAPIIRAEALEKVADDWVTRSETYLHTMQNMVGSRDYSHDDIIRYGAYSAEAQTTSVRIRARAAAVRGEG